MNLLQICELALCGIFVVAAVFWAGRAIGARRFYKIKQELKDLELSFKNLTDDMEMVSASKMRELEGSLEKLSELLTIADKKYLCLADLLSEADSSTERLKFFNMGARANSKQNELIEYKNTKDLRDGIKNLSNETAALSAQIEELKENMSININIQIEKYIKNYAQNYIERCVKNTARLFEAQNNNSNSARFFMPKSVNETKALLPAAANADNGKLLEQSNSENNSKNCSENGSENCSENYSKNDCKNYSENRSKNYSENYSKNCSENCSENNSENDSENAALPFMPCIQKTAALLPEAPSKSLPAALYFNGCKAPKDDLALPRPQVGVKSQNKKALASEGKTPLPPKAPLPANCAHSATNLPIIEIFKLRRSGLKITEIAEKLNISKTTVSIVLELYRGDTAENSNLGVS